MSKIDTQC